PTSETLAQLVPSLSAYPLDIDLYGSKTTAQLQQPWVLTSREGTGAVAMFDDALFPLSQNLILDLPGTGLRLVKTADRSATPPARERFYRTRSIGPAIYGERSRQQCSIGLVVPAVQAPPDAVLTTLRSIEQQASESVEVLLVVPSSAAQAWPEATIASLRELSQKVVVVTEAAPSIWAQLNAGFAQLHTDVCGWLHPGTTLQPGCLHEVQRVFSGYQAINWVQPIHFNKFVPLALRLNAYLAQRLQRLQQPLPSTEGMFWRSITWSTNGDFPLSPDAESAWLLRWLAHEKLYPVMRHWLASEQAAPKVIAMEQAPAVPGNTPSLTWRFAASILRWLENRIDSHYVHDFYGGLFDLPGVLRYDGVHGTFSLERY
ncbi:MAG: hypothetical protein AAGB22_11410, partial [Bacteroidota bacterium]